MFTVALDPHDLGGCLEDETSTEQHLCAGCQGDGSCGIGLLSRCALCLLWWHKQCSLQSIAFLNSFMVNNGTKSLADYDMDRSHIPFLFLHLVHAPNILPFVFCF